MIYQLAKIILSRRNISLQFKQKYLFLDIILFFLVLLNIFFFQSQYLIISISFLEFYLLILIITDCIFFIIPNILTYIYIILGIVLQLLNPFGDVVFSILGALCGTLFLGGLAKIISILLKKESIGGGDLKLVFMLGIFVGWQGILMVIFLGSLLALIYITIIQVLKKKLIRVLPFGPFLMISSIITIIFLDKILTEYNQIIF